MGRVLKMVRQTTKFVDQLRAHVQDQRAVACRLIIVAGSDRPNHLSQRFLKLQLRGQDESTCRFFAPQGRKQCCQSLFDAETNQNVEIPLIFVRGAIGAVGLHPLLKDRRHQVKFHPVLARSIATNSESKLICPNPTNPSRRMSRLAPR